MVPGDGPAPVSHPVGKDILCSPAAGGQLRHPSGSAQYTVVVCWYHGQPLLIILVLSLILASVLASRLSRGSSGYFGLGSGAPGGVQYL